MFESDGALSELVNVFEHYFEGLEVQLIWFIKKRRRGDGFQTWHQDLVANGTTAATIVVNIDSLLEEEELYQIEQIRESHRIMEEVSATTGSNSENDDRAPDATSSGPNNKNESERGNDTGHSNVVTVHNLFRISTANKAFLPDVDDRKRPPEAPDDTAYGHKAPLPDVDDHKCPLEAPEDTGYGPNYENESEPGEDRVPYEAASAVPSRMYA